MIRVIVGDCAMTVDGHAGSGPYGSDLVCAAVSALTYTLAENLRLNGEDGIVCRMDPGSSEIRCVPSDGARQVFLVVLRGLSMLEKSFPENIKILSLPG